MHLREISRQLDIPRSTLKYHLGFLERKNLLKSENKGKCTRYFAQYEIGSVDKEILMFIRQEIPRMILLLSYYYDEIYIDELSEGLDSPVTTISFHLKKLKESGILGLSKNNGRAAYFLINRNSIYNLFIKYGDSALNDDLFSACIFFLKKNEADHIKKPQRNRHIKDEDIDPTLNVVFKLFPVPFCA